MKTARYFETSKSEYSMTQRRKQEERNPQLRLSENLKKKLYYYHSEEAKYLRPDI
jgi:hypothetical protein